MLSACIVVTQGWEGGASRVLSDCIVVTQGWEGERELPACYQPVVWSHRVGIYAIRL